MSTASRKKAVYKRMGNVILDESVHNLLANKQIQPRFDRLGILKGLYVAVAGRPKRLIDVIDATFQHVHVKHLNGNQWDFRRSNLEVVSRTELSNLNNTLTDLGNPGLVRQAKSGMFTAAINLNKTVVHLGTYASKEDAIAVYQHQVIVRQTLFASPDFDLEKYKAIKTAEQGRQWLGFTIRKGR